MKPAVCTTTKKDGRIYARLTYLDELGKQRQVYRRARNKSHARELKIDLIIEYASAERPGLRAKNDARNSLEMKMRENETPDFKPIK